jgi:hypothetical protein
MNGKLLSGAVLGVASLGVGVGTPLALAGPASANGNLINQTFPISTQVQNPCNGDLVDLSGTDHVVQTQTGDGSFLTSQDIHLTGQDINDGTPYVANRSTHVTSPTATLPPKAPFSFNDHVVLVSQGSDPNFVVTLTGSIPPGPPFSMQGPRCVGPTPG